MIGTKNRHDTIKQHKTTVHIRLVYRVYQICSAIVPIMKNVLPDFKRIFRNCTIPRNIWLKWMHPGRKAVEQRLYFELLPEV